MSKSLGNIVSPEDIIEKYGADTARLFILFAAPPEKDLEWSDQGVEGCFRFLQRVWRLVEELMPMLNAPSGDEKADREVRRLVHKTIKKVTDDIEGRFNFNTAISAIMEMVNVLNSSKGKPVSGKVIREAVETLLLLLAPFAPHITEELWERLGHETSIHLMSWPVADEAAMAEEEVEVVVQVNGKVRAKILMPAEITEEAMKESALKHEKISSLLEGKTVVKVITVPRKLVNIVVN